jgi:hypothetical protein
LGFEGKLLRPARLLEVLGDLLQAEDIGQMPVAHAYHSRQSRR